MNLETRRNRSQHCWKKSNSFDFVVFSTCLTYFYGNFDTKNCSRNVCRSIGSSLFFVRIFLSANFVRSESKSIIEGFIGCVKDVFLPGGLRSLDAGLAL